MDDASVSFEGDSLQSIQNQLDAVVNVRSCCYKLGCVGLERPVSAFGANTIVMFGPREKELHCYGTGIVVAAE